MYYYDVCVIILTLCPFFWAGLAVAAALRLGLFACVYCMWGEFSYCDSIFSRSATALD